MKPRTIYSLIQAVLALVGAGIAGFIYREHELNLSIPCSNGGGCDIVNASHWAYFLGYPVSLYGAFAYMMILLSAVIKLTTDSEKVAGRIGWFLFLATACGFVISWIFQYIAKYMIGAFCIWCRASAITMTLLLVVSILDVIAASQLAKRAALESLAQK